MWRRWGKDQGRPRLVCVETSFPTPSPIPCLNGEFPVQLGVGPSRVVLRSHPSMAFPKLAFPVEKQYGYSTSHFRSILLFKVTGTIYE